MENVVLVAEYHIFMLSISQRKEARVPGTAEAFWSMQH
jgi:hypothetical protein